MMLVHNIKTRCKEQNLSLSELEEKAGLGTRTIYRWDDSLPSADKLIRVAKILNTTAEELMAQ
jgi:transcriptional regulator with XRE-family HTH domain